ncbi:MAG: NYN domain-containing protein [Candidatus Thermoplasmatota archaeon]|nr:NYN domain-containing protein [Candidatus Thermoplasmatota archaeon]
MQREVTDKLKGNYGKFSLDYEEFSNSLCRDINSERFRTYIYDVPLESNRKFLTSLNLQSRFEIRLGKLQENEKGFHQKQVDILIAIDMIRLALKNRIQHVILITGDGDFVPAVQFVKEEGIMVHLRHADATYSKDLSQVCDTSKPLTRNSLIEFDRKEAYRR